MDALKEHRLLLTLLGGVAASICVYLFVSSPALDEASKDLKNISQSEIDRLSRIVNAEDFPDAGAIRLRREQRHEMLRDLYRSYRVYLEWSRPLRTFPLPGAGREDRNQYNNRLGAFINELQVSYVGSSERGIEGFRRAVPQAEQTRSSFGSQTQQPTVEEPFASFPTVSTPEEIPLNQKRFWVMLELFQIVRDAAREVRQQGDEAPYCEIQALNLEYEVRPDPTGLLQGIPFTMNLRVSPEMWPLIVQKLHESHVDPSFTAEEMLRLYNEGNELRQQVQRVLNAGRIRERPGQSSRIGIRFDRIRPTAVVGPIADQFRVVLRSDEVAQEVFMSRYPAERWNAGQVVPPNPEQPDVFRDQMIKDMYDELRQRLGPKPTYVNLVISGEAVDFLPDLTADGLNFWRRMNLSTDDVVETLKMGIDEAVPADNPDAWPACQLIEGQHTNLSPVYVPYKMTVSAGARSLEMDPHIPYRLSEEGLRIVATAIRRERIGASDDETE